MRAARRFLVKGRVQGVGFRYFAQDAAYREGLTGWVQNLDDGGLEAVVEGEAGAIDRFERALNNGPPQARVIEVDSEPLPPGGRFVGFNVR